MTTQDIKQLFSYNRWANNRIFEAVSQLSPEQYFQDLKSSYGGVHGTLTHILGAHKIWLERWSGKTDLKLLKGEDVSSFDELKKLWNDLNEKTTKLIDTFTDEKLNETYTITTTKGDVYIHTYSQMFSHLVNHSSYHRGQITTMLRQLGAKPIGTDMIVFQRERK